MEVCVCLCLCVRTFFCFFPSVPIYHQTLSSQKKKKTATNRKRESCQLLLPLLRLPLPWCSPAYWSDGKGRKEGKEGWKIHKSSDKKWIDLFGRKCIGNIKRWHLISWISRENVNSECEVCEGHSIRLWFIHTLNTFSATKSYLICFADDPSWFASVTRGVFVLHSPGL